MELIMKYRILSCFLGIFFLAPSIAETLDIKKTERPAIQLASRYDDTVSIKRYLVSEKLDGVRARWDGKRLITRGGHIISAPHWFTQHFPEQVLDGELWIARGRFDEISGIIRRQKNTGESWKFVTFNVFDLPQSTQPFLQRYHVLKELLDNVPSTYITLIEHRELQNITQLTHWLDSVVALQGEGLMLHHKEAYYEHKRSKNLLKFKKVYDAEARVIGHIEGKGKYKGMLGAMLMETTKGIQFKLGSGMSDELRRNPPPIGTLVTYQYFGVTKNGKPRFASYLRIRTSE